MLVVDDEPAIRALVAKIVERAGLAVETAAHGGEAIEKMETAKYDVLVIDLMMPILDGFGVLDYVRDMKGDRPAVIVASATDSAILRRLDGHIVHSIIRKPFEIDVLGELIVAAAESVRKAEKHEGAKVVDFPRVRH